MTPATLAALQECDATAVISDCGHYRYELHRKLDCILRWNRRILWIMLNPSTADAAKNDPTIRRCINFSTAWGCSRLMVGNLYALRSTDPRALKRPPDGIDAVGAQNDAHLEGMAAKADVIVLAWGQRGPIKNRSSDVIANLWSHLPRLHVLGWTQSGEPRHPLMMPKATELRPFTPDAGVSRSY